MKLKAANRKNKKLKAPNSNTTKRVYVKKKSSKDLTNANLTKEQMTELIKAKKSKKKKAKKVESASTVTTYEPAK